MMTDFTRETLEIAQSFIPLNVEIAMHDADGCTLNIGTYCRLECPEAQGAPYNLSLEPMPGYSWTFEHLEAACHAAYLIESTFTTVREASTITFKAVA